MEEKKYIVEEVGVAGYGARLYILKGKNQGIEITSFNVTPGEFVKKNRTHESCVKLSHRENEKIVIAIYEDLPK